MTVSAYAAAVMLGALRGEGTFLQLHTGEPGDGTDFVAKERRRNRVFFADPANRTMRSSSALWQNVAAAETFTHFSVWSRDRMFLGAGQLQPVETVNSGDDLQIDYVDWTQT